MSLTQQEFLTVVDQTSPDVINIWYSNTEPLTVFGFTIPVIDNQNTNAIQLLQAVQQINMTLNGYNYTFDILDRAERTAPDGTTYYFFDIDDLIINPAADDIGILIDQVIFIIPGLQDISFLGGDYDALLNNVDLNRLSTNIMVSDRFKVVGGVGSLNPLNIQALRTQTAEKASIQDSNYEISGWSNARYRGTQSDSTEYGGIASAIAGKIFEGSIFPLSLSTSSINLQASSSQVIYSEYFFSSDQDLPTTPVLVDTSYRTVDTTIPPSDTEIQIRSISTSDPGIFIGDIIKILPDSGTTNELMRVTNFQPFFTNFIIKVDRGWNSTPISDVYGTSNLTIQKVGSTGPVKIYELEGNRIQGVLAGQLLVKESLEIIKTDVLGQLLPG
jgi:hypothetical protein